MSSSAFSPRRAFPPGVRPAEPISAAAVPAPWLPLHAVEAWRPGPSPSAASAHELEVGGSAVAAVRRAACALVWPAPPLQVSAPATLMRRLDTVPATPPAPLLLPSLPERAWRALLAHPYGFTDASVVASAAALAALARGLFAGAAQLRVQWSRSGVCVLDADIDASARAGAGGEAPVLAIKRTIGNVRLLALLPHGALVPRPCAAAAAAAAAPERDASLSAGSEFVGSAGAGGQLELLAPLAICGVDSYADAHGSSLSSSSSSTSSSASPLESVADGLAAVLGGTGAGANAPTPESLTQAAHSAFDWLRRQLRAAQAATPTASGTSLWLWTLDPSPAVGAATAASSFIDTSSSAIPPRLSLQRCSLPGEDDSGAPPAPFLVRPDLVQLLLMRAGPLPPPPPPHPAPQPQHGAGKRPRLAEDGGEPGAERDRQRALAPAPALGPAGGVMLAVIVPFREQREQNRGLQLQRFAEALPRFLRSAAVTPPLRGFHIVVIEQSDDGFKFNRGKLLNAGFLLTAASAGERAARIGLPATLPAFDAFCFHDVDLLPGAPLGPWYGRRPVPRPVHAGSAWQRYPYPTYIGGILTLSERDVRATNGFPNDFWGWGGEDDEMHARMAGCGLLPPDRPPASVAATAGAIEDLEEALIRERGGERAGTSLKDGGRSEWRNMWKRENLARHAATWRTNGVSALDFGVLATRRLSADVTVVTVDLRGASDPQAQRQVHTEPLPEEGRHGAGAGETARGHS